MTHDPRQEGSPFYSPPGGDGRLLGPYRGVVKDINDPNKNGRIRCFLPQLFQGDGTDETQWTNWCEPEFCFGGTDDASATTAPGAFCVPPVGSRVVVEFEMGDPDFPIYRGGYYRERALPPKLAIGESDGSPVAGFTLAGVSVAGEGGGSSSYGYNRMVRTPAGIIVELDDTADNMRVRVHHPQGAYIEMDKDGGIVVRAKNGGALTLASNGGDLHGVASQVVLAAAMSLKLGDASATEHLVLGDTQKTFLVALVAALTTFATGLTTVNLPANAAALVTALNGITFDGTLSAKVTTI